jgi:hypothetical protein
MMPGIEPVENCCSGAADMEITCGAWGEADTNIIIWFRRHTLKINSTPKAFGSPLFYFLIVN